jgi:SAM-dependent methyltransferase
MSSLWSSAPARFAQKHLTAIVDFELNYGRASIAEFARRVAPFGSVLDIGAGPGTDLAACLAASPAARPYAIEFDPQNCETLRARGVEVVSLNLEQDPFPFAAQSIDLVVANQVLEHVKELFWILHHVTRVLPVGGHFIIGVPNLASLHNRLILLAGMQPTPINSFSAHVRGFTRHDLLRLMNSCFPGGYELAGFRGGNFYPFPPGLARPLARALPNLAWGIFLLLRKTRPYGDEFLAVPQAERFETNFHLG